MDAILSIESQVMSESVREYLHDTNQSLLSDHFGSDDSSDGS